MESHDSDTRQSCKSKNDVDEIAEDNDQENEVTELKNQYAVFELKNQNELNKFATSEKAVDGSESSDDSDDEVETTDDESEGSDTGEITAKNDDVVHDLNDDEENSKNDESSDNDDDDEDSDTEESDDADDEDSCHSSMEILEQDEGNEEEEEEDKEPIPVCNSNSDTSNVAETIYQLSDECYENQGECTCLLYSEAEEADGKETVEGSRNDDNDISRCESFDCNKTFVVKQCTCNSAKAKTDMNEHDDESDDNKDNDDNDDNSMDISDNDQNEKTQVLTNEFDEGINLDKNSANPQAPTTHELSEGGVDSNNSLDNTTTTQNNTMLPGNEQDGVANLRNSFRREKSKLLDTTPSLERLVNEIEEEYTVDLIHQKNDSLGKTENEFYELEAQILMDYG